MQGKYVGLIFFVVVFAAQVKVEAGRIERSLDEVIPPNHGILDKMAQWFVANIASEFDNMFPPPTEIELVEQNIVKNYPKSIVMTTTVYPRYKREVVSKNEIDGSSDNGKYALLKKLEKISNYDANKINKKNKDVNFKVKPFNYDNLPLIETAKKFITDPNELEQAKIINKGTSNGASIDQIESYLTNQLKRLDGNQFKSNPLNENQAHNARNFPIYFIESPLVVMDQTTTATWYVNGDDDPKNGKNKANFIDMRKQNDFKSQNDADDALFSYLFEALMPNMMPVNVNKNYPNYLNSEQSKEFLPDYGSDYNVWQPIFVDTAYTPLSDPYALIYYAPPDEFNLSTFNEEELLDKLLSQIFKPISTISAEENPNVLKRHTRSLPGIGMAMQPSSLTSGVADAAASAAAASKSAPDVGSVLTPPEAPSAASALASPDLASAIPGADAASALAGADAASVIPDAASVISAPDASSVLPSGIADAIPSPDAASASGIASALATPDIAKAIPSPVDAASALTPDLSQAIPTSISDPTAIMGSLAAVNPLSSIIPDASSVLDPLSLVPKPATSGSAASAASSASSGSNSGGSSAAASAASASSSSGSSGSTSNVSLTTFIATFGKLFKAAQNLDQKLIRGDSTAVTGFFKDYRSILEEFRENFKGLNSGSLSNGSKMLDGMNQLIDAQEQFIDNGLESYFSNVHSDYLNLRKNRNPLDFMNSVFTRSLQFSSSPGATAYASAMGEAGMNVAMGSMQDFGKLPFAAAQSASLSAVGISSTDADQTFEAFTNNDIKGISEGVSNMQKSTKNPITKSIFAMISPPLSMMSKALEVYDKFKSSDVIGQVTSFANEMSAGMKQMSSMGDNVNKLVEQLSKMMGAGGGAAGGLGGLASMAGAMGKVA